MTSKSFIAPSIAVFACLLSISTACAQKKQPEKKQTPTRFRAHDEASKDGDDSLSGAQRERLAFSSKRATVRQLLSAVSLRYPAKRLLFRVFKKEEHLDVWASNTRNGRMVRVATYSICSTSGSAGPKKAEGDGQVPEGFYTLDYYKRKSTYYLAMRVNYPNARDRQLKYTGSAIMIHGKCVSIGCLAMTDDRIQELWVLARSASKYGRVHVHIYPRRDLAKAIASTKDKALQAFWRNLQQGHALFERNRTIPRIGAKNGVYQFR